MKNFAGAANDSAANSNKPSEGPGILDEVCLLSKELPALMQDHLALAALETRQAGESLVTIIALGVITACLVFGCWVALMGMVAVALIEHGLISGAVALLILAIANGLTAALLIGLIHLKSRKLLFSASVNSLHSEPTEHTESTGKSTEHAEPKMKTC